ncbi:hypothetical protein PQR70_43060, partial [Paraburkholderia madseniana]|uniref:hypothetical protein n=1 Tax=Paraburkholderia madseniana TaxID=2599607 RepID=UPI0038B872D7
MLSGACGLLRVVVHLESVFVHRHTPVTRASFFRRRCARRRVLLKTTRDAFALSGGSVGFLVCKADRIVLHAVSGAAILVEDRELVRC